MRAERSVFLLYLAFSAAVFAYWVLSPIYNWDHLGYVACAGSLRSADVGGIARARSKTAVPDGSGRARFPDGPETVRQLGDSSLI